MTIRRILLSIAAVLMATTASAQSAPVLQANDVVQYELPTKQGGEATLSGDNETISVDFPDEDVRTIITNVADLYDLNVVIPETLVGRLTLKLKDVTWRQVFDVVLEPLGYTYVEEENIIKIKSIADMLQEPVETQVFIINYATAGELSGSIKPLIDERVGGRLQVDARSNALVVTERPSRMGGIQSIIERLDQPTHQVMIESKMIEVTRDEAKNIGVDWASMSGMELTGENVSRQWDRLTGNGATTAAESRTDTAVFSASQFKMILSALEDNEGTEVISNPTIVTLNNTPASIHVGQRYPIPDFTYNEERGTFEVSDFEFEDLGITLEVTPQVNAAGFINLDVKPEVSNTDGTVEFGGAAGTEIPIIATRTTVSKISIKSGYTLAIGGLIDKTTGKSGSKIPVLGDIPVLGRLFSSKGEEVQERNLIIFITAKVLNPEGSTYQDVFDERTLYQMGINERDVPGYAIPAHEVELYRNVRTSEADFDAIQTENKLRQKTFLLEEAKEQEAAAEAKRESDRMGE